MPAKAQPKAKAAKKPVKKTPTKPQGEWPPKSISEEKVKAATGKGWMGWFSILNNMNANALPHKDVAKTLREKHGAPRWWNQMIAVEYERARGGQKKNEREGGTFAVNVTKVVPVSLAKLFATATSAHKDWFPPGAFEETSKTKDKYWRGKWKAGRKLEFGFYAKGDGKASIMLEIRQIPSEAGLEKERTAWKKAMEKLASLLT